MNKPKTYTVKITARTSLHEYSTALGGELQTILHTDTNEFTVNVSSVSSDYYRICKAAYKTHATLNKLHPNNLDKLPHGKNGYGVIWCAFPESNRIQTTLFFEII